MKIFGALLIFLLPQLASGEPDQNGCAAIEALGTPTLARFNYSIALTVDDEGEYTIAMNFKHDEDLPVASDPALQCDPSITPPALADDGLPYYAFRWFYQTVPEKVKKISGIDHISIDWNACGHPPVNVFTSMHYDVHVYKETPEFRTCMTCELIPGAPVCDPTDGAQPTDAGKAFFNVSMVPGSEQPNNMPEGFVVTPGDMVPLMGAHGWSPAQQPESFLTWDTPIYIMGSYDGEVRNFEPMIPMAFMSGTEDKVHEETLVYEGLSMKELPNMYKVEYSGETSVVTITFKGTSLMGAPKKKSKKEPKKDKPSKKKPKKKKPSKKPKKTKKPKA